MTKKVELQAGLLPEGVLQTLQNDCLALKPLARGGDQVHRRSYARAVFALIESLFDTLRFITQLSCSYHPVLKDRADELSKEASRKRSFKDQGKLIFKMMNESRNRQPPISITDRGWKAVTAAQAVRNRLAHPKWYDALDLSDADLDTFDEALTWVINVGPRIALG